MFKRVQRAPSAVSPGASLGAQPTTSENAPTRNLHRFSRIALEPATPSAVLQLANCMVCHHNHGANVCPTCGCTSHSGHWGKNQPKHNPGNSKRARKLAANSAAGAAKNSDKKSNGDKGNGKKGKGKKED